MCNRCKIKMANILREGELLSLLLVRDNGNSKIDTEPDDIDNNDDEVEIMYTGVSEDENQEEEGDGLFG